MLESVEADGTVDVSGVVDNASDLRGVEAPLAARLTELRRMATDCERALRFSAAMVSRGGASLLPHPPSPPSHGVTRLPSLACRLPSLNDDDVRAPRLSPQREFIARPDAECPVCLETYEIAAVLPCLHATCRQCMRTHAGGGASFRCPLCRAACARREVATFAKGSDHARATVGSPVAVVTAAAGAARATGAGAAVAATVAPEMVVPTNMEAVAAAAAVAPASTPLAVASTYDEAAASHSSEWSGLLGLGPTTSDLPGASSRVRVLVALLRGILASGDNERVLVFAQWAAHVAHLAAVLERVRVRHLTLGDTLADSMAALQAFGQPDEPRILLMSSQRHASGINLQCARHVVIMHPYCTPTARDAHHLSLSDLASYERQAIGRVRRFPQQHQVEVYRFVAPGTVEEEVYTGRIEES